MFYDSNINCKHIKIKIKIKNNFEKQLFNNIF